MKRRKSLDGYFLINERSNWSNLHAVRRFTVDMILKVLYDDLFGLEQMTILTEQNVYNFDA